MCRVVSLQQQIHSCRQQSASGHVAADAALAPTARDNCCYSRLPIGQAQRCVVDAYMLQIGIVETAYSSGGAAALAMD
jgi:hypothetical protein